MTHHAIVLDAATANDKTYHITNRSHYVYNTTKSHSPTRFVVWDNTHRVNPRNGERVRYGNYGAIDGGNGRYLNPKNEATDAPVSVLLTPEASAICADTRMNTGQPGSGQVYASGTLADGDTATLLYPDMSTREVTIHLPRHNNGHGYAEFTEVYAS